MLEECLLELPSHVFERSLVQLSPAAGMFIDRSSACDAPTRVALRTTDGALIRWIDTNPVRDLDVYQRGDYALVAQKSATVYLFKRDGLWWNQQATLTPVGGVGFEGYCRAVALDGAYAVVGAHNDSETDLAAGAVFFFAGDFLVVFFLLDAVFFLVDFFDGDFFAADFFLVVFFLEAGARRVAAFLAVVFFLVVFFFPRPLDEVATRRPTL